MGKLLSSLLISSFLLSAYAAEPSRILRPEGDGPPSHESAGGWLTITHMQEQLHALEESLKLNPKQLPFWNAYQDRLSALIADQMRLSPYRSRQDAIQLIAQKVDTVRNRLAAMEDVQEAAAALYAALDDGQKKVADRLLAPTVPALNAGISCESPRNAERNSQQMDHRQGGPGGMHGGMTGGGTSPF